MTDATARAVAAIDRILAKAHSDGADPTWTAHAILTALRGLGWRPTEAGTPPDWRNPHQLPTPPSADYLAERARLLGEPQP